MRYCIQHTINREFLFSLRNARRGYNFGSNAVSYFGYRHLLLTIGWGNQLFGNKNYHFNCTYSAN